MTTETRYQVRSKYDGREYYWVWDTHKQCRIGNVTVQQGRAITRAAGLETDWQAAIERLGIDRATLIYG